MSKIVVFVFLSLFSFSVFAQSPPCDRAGYNTTSGTPFPYVETEGLKTRLMGDGKAVIILPYCKAVFQGTGTYNTLIRSFIPVYENLNQNVAIVLTVKVQKSGGSVSDFQYVRAIKTFDKNNAQVERFSTSVFSLSGENKFQVEIAYNGSGYVDIDTSYFNLFSSPVSYGASSTECINGSCNLAIQSDGKTDPILDGNVTIDRLPANLSVILDGKTLFSTTVYNYTQGFFYGGLKRLASGIHIITLISSNANIAGNLSLISFPSSVGFYSHIEITNPVTIDSSPTSPMNEQPRAYVLVSSDFSGNNGTCAVTNGPNFSIASNYGQWTKIATIEIPGLFNPNQRCCNWIQSGVVEISPPIGDWRGYISQLAVENIYHHKPGTDDCDIAAEFGIMSFTPVQNDSNSALFFAGGFMWGNQYGNTINLWARKIVIDGRTNAAPFQITHVSYDVRLIDDSEPITPQRKRGVRP